MSGKFNMDDYVPVNERIDAFYRQFPEGSIQGEIVELTSSRVTVKAYAYRNPTDERPGIGHSSLDIPGSTPYTRGSEVENAETSAWGRAIAALGFEVKRGIASREEIHNKRNGHDSPATGSPSTRPAGRKAHTQAGQPSYRRAELSQLMARHHLDLDAVEAIADALGIQERPMSDASMDRLIAAIETPDAGAETPAPATDAGVVSPPAPASGTDLLQKIVDVTGGELIPPKPGTPEYKALPALERAQARSYWDKHPEPEPETLAEQLRVGA